MSGRVEEVWFESDGQRLYGRLRGGAEGSPVIVLLCGLGFHTFEYEPLCEVLSSHGLACLSFDYRGHGRSEGARGDWTLAELASDASRAVAVARDRWSGPVCAFGNSLGAMVAVSLGVADDRVSSVVASNCPARIGEFLLTPFRRRLFAIAKRAARWVPLRISVNHFYSYDRLTTDTAWLERIRSDRAISASRRFTVRTYRALLEGWDGPTAVRDLHKPLLVVQGERDEFQPPRQSELLFRAANQPKDYLAVPTGHLPHLDDPSDLGARIRAWLAGRRAPAAQRTSTV